MVRRFKQFVRDSKAVSALEYAILVGIVAVAVGAAVVTFTGQINTSMTTIGTDVGKIVGPGVPKTK